MLTIHCRRECVFSLSLSPSILHPRTQNLCFFAAISVLCLPAGLQPAADGGMTTDVQVLLATANFCARTFSLFFSF